VRGLALLVFVTACRYTGTFECGDDGVCRRGEDLGVCEVEGYCSFGDSACPSGRRYDDNAGDGLADECVADTAEPLSCLERWRTDTIRFGAVADPGVNSPMDDRDPWFSSAGDRLMFSSDRGPGATLDVYQATRADVTVPFGTPALVSALSSPSADSRVSFSTDMLTVYLTSNRTGSKGGSDVWRATRTSTGGAFSTPDQATVAMVNTADEELDVMLSSDGLNLYLATGKTGQTQRLAVATRATGSDELGPASVIAELDTGGGDADPAVSSDELLLLFTSLRPAAFGGSNLWYTTRASVTDKWLRPRLVPDVNTDGFEGDAYLAGDACTIFFSFGSAVSQPRDLFYAGVTP
jgi:hypothetical protein